MKKLFAIAALTAAVLCASDVKGTWTGQVNRPDGTKETDVVLELSQDGDAVTGKVGTHSADMVSIQKAKLDSNKLTFEVPTSSATYTVNLELAGDTLKGGVVRMRDGQSSPSLAMELKRSAR